MEPVMKPETQAEYEDFYEEVKAGSCSHCITCHGGMSLRSTLNKEYWYFRHEEDCKFVTWMIEEGL